VDCHLGHKAGWRVDDKGDHDDVLVLLTGAKEDCDAVVAVPGLPQSHVHAGRVCFCMVRMHWIRDLMGMSSAAVLQPPAYGADQMFKPGAT
jgi:hypothetical protein